MAYTIVPMSTINKQTAALTSVVTALGIKQWSPEHKLVMIESIVTEVLTGTKPEIELIKKEAMENGR